MKKKIINIRDRKRGWLAALATVATLSAMATGVAAPEQAETSSEQAHITFVNKIVDVGNIDGRAEVSGKIRFVNTGNAPLRLKWARGDCGCTSATYKPESVAPGDTTSVTVYFNPKGRIGKFRKMVRIGSNADNGVCVAYITGYIDSE